jgi:polyhydroxybutyrate depolymerase
VDDVGFMAYTLACRTTIFAAIGPGSATQLGSARTLKVSTEGTETISVADCPDGRRVELVSVAGMGHQWAPDATETIWQFFSR